MIEPTTALLVFTIFVAVTAVVAWPRQGLAWRLLRLSRLDERVRLEDALKHVYMCERRGQPCTLESLAGRLEVSTGRAASLLTRLTEMDLVRADGEGPSLTTGGRESALRVLRTHRLWERYLADRTGLPAGEWHTEAERMEHALSEAEVDELEARLGHPRWDPHGDPIPTSEGDLPPVRGDTLLNVAVGRTVEIVHLEDEPPEIFDALLADGLAPGGRLEVMERTDSVVRVRAGGRELSLDPVAARNVTVAVLPVGTPGAQATDTLLDARLGEAVRVIGISAACQGTQRRRLLDLGVIPGTLITPELVSASGDPVAYRIRDALIALRGDQAAWINTESIPFESEGAA